MKPECHVVLGGSGAIRRSVIGELQKRKIPVVHVGRTKPVVGVENRKADLLDSEQVFTAAIGASHVYLCAGIPYHHKIWEVEWPRMMANVIAACHKLHAKLIFVDNVYLYGPPPLSVPFTEDHPQSPTTKKGRVRKAVADALLAAHQQGKIQGVIGRAADFYGPDLVNSQLYVMVLKNMLAGKPPQWLGSPRAKHTYANTQDVGRALVALALHEKAYGQVWHLPVSDPITFAEIATMLNGWLGTRLSPSYMPAWLLVLASVFVPILAEVKEMNYQFTQDYLMDWSKFRQAFPDFAVTPFASGLRAMLDSFQTTQ
jgi:nucleoside-diphosphate-sugar epimerase